MDSHQFSPFTTPQSPMLMPPPSVLPPMSIPPPSLPPPLTNERPNETPPHHPNHHLDRVGGGHHHHHGGPRSTAAAAAANSLSGGAPDPKHLNSLNQSPALTPSLFNSLGSFNPLSAPASHQQPATPLQSVPSTSAGASTSADSALHPTLQ